MLAIALLAVIVTSAIWVYWDASANHIGDIRRYGLDHRSSPTTLALATLFLWPIAFPAYLRVRARLIELAGDFPNHETNRLTKAIVLAAVGIGFMLLSVGYPQMESIDSASDSIISATQKERGECVLENPPTVNKQACDLSR